MSPPHDSRDDELTDEQMLLVNRLCNQFESRWRNGEEIGVEQFLSDVTEQDRFAALNELLPLELEFRIQAGHTFTLEEYTARFPDLPPSWFGELLQTTRTWHGSQVRDNLLETSEIPRKLGDYRIVSRIGGGGMGTVYQAIHERMGRTVALKVLRTEIQRDPQLLKRFDREVRAAARLTHPNIVTALDAREHDGLHFLITEYVDGVDLQALVIQNGPLGVTEAVDYILQVARGLDYAHHQGIIHRDIKPANLLRDSQGVVKILDMGLARVELPGDSTTMNLTQSGMVLGTAAYMSPEQARNTRSADARSDIYSLGCTLYYLLNGRNLYAGQSVIDTIISHVNHPIPSLTRSDVSVPASLERIFHQMVAKDPADRFQTAAELVAALETAATEIRGQRLPVHHSQSDFTTRISSSARGIPIDGANQNLDTRPASTPTEVLPHRDRRSHHSRTGVQLLTRGGVILVLLVGMVLIVFPPKFSGEHPEDTSSETVSRTAGLEFDGFSSYVSVPELIPEADETYTLEAVFQPQRFRTSNVISWLGPNWMALFVTEAGHVGICRRVSGENHLIRSRDPVPLNQTVHLAGVFRGRELKIYLNGQPVEGIPFPFDLRESHGGLCIGGVPLSLLPEGQNDRFFYGIIRAVRISRGVKSAGSFLNPGALRVDEETIALFPFDEGTGVETHGTGQRPWLGRIMNAKWLPMTH